MSVNTAGCVSWWSVTYIVTVCYIVTLHTLLLLLLLLHPFNGLFRTTWVSRHQKGKPFWILLEQEMMRWQWDQLHHMQIICTLLQTDNNASTWPLSFWVTVCKTKTLFVCFNSFTFELSLQQVSKHIISMEVGHSPGDFVLDKDPVHFPQKGAEPPPHFSAHFYLVAKWLHASKCNLV